MFRIPVGDDGKLGEATAFMQHHGNSVNKERQEGPHAHYINLDAAGRFAFVADLGLDKVLIFKYDAKKGKFTPNDPDSVATKGRRPRPASHSIAFSEAGVRSKHGSSLPSGG